jgi:hypothetical protein
MRWLRTERDQPVTMTHTSPERFQPGDIIERRGEKFRITRVVSVAPTRLLAGGVAPCWEVRGVPVQEGEPCGS